MAQVGGSILASVPLLLLALRAQQTVEPTKLMLGLSVSTGLASLLFFPAVTRLSNGFWLFLLADTLIHPAAFANGAMMCGLALKHASSARSSWYSADNFTVVIETCVENIVGRFVAAPVARALLESGGRGLYAGVQLSLITLSAATVVGSFGAIRRLET